jgi:hypothetical protein
MTRLNPERRLERFPAGTGSPGGPCQGWVSDRELITKRVDDLERKLDVLAQAREH